MRTEKRILEEIQRIVEYKGRLSENDDAKLALEWVLKLGAGAPSKRWYRKKKK